MKVTVDFDLCESNALCEALAPDVFELDDDDFLVIKKEQLDPEDVAAAQKAAVACPRAAIKLEE